MIEKGRDRPGVGDRELVTESWRPRVGDLELAT